MYKYRSDLKEKPRPLVLLCRVCGQGVEKTKARKKETYRCISCQRRFVRNHHNKLIQL